VQVEELDCRSILSIFPISKMSNCHGFVSGDEGKQSRHSASLGIFRQYSDEGLLRVQSWSWMRWSTSTLLLFIPGENPMGLCGRLSVRLGRGNPLGKKTYTSVAPRIRYVCSRNCSTIQASSTPFVYPQLLVVCSVLVVVLSRLDYAESQPPRSIDASFFLITVVCPPFPLRCSIRRSGGSRRFPPTAAG